TQGHMLQDDILRSFSNFFPIEVKESRRIQPANLKSEALRRFTGHYQINEELEYPLKASIGSENQLILYDPNDGMRSAYLPLNDSTFIEIDSGLEIRFTTDSQSGKVKSMDFSGMYTFDKVD